MDERVWEKTAQFLKELRCEDTGRLSQLQLPEYQKAVKEKFSYRPIYEQTVSEVTEEQKRIIGKYVGLTEECAEEENQQAYLQGMVDMLLLLSGSGILKVPLDMLEKIKQGEEIRQVEETILDEFEEIKSSGQSENEGADEEETESEDLAELEENPFQCLEQIERTGILSVAMPKDMPLSGRQIDLDLQASKRSLQTGRGKFPMRKNTDKAKEKLLFNEYIMQNFTQASKENISEYPDSDEKNRSLDYEIEYIISGKSSDKENLESVVTKIFFIRMALNYVYLMGDSVKKSEAMALAATISTLLLIPEAAEAVKQLILLAWAAGEGVIDIRSLLSGNKVPLVKTSDNWQLTLASLFTLGIGDDGISGADAEEGITYKEYLRAFLFLQPEEETTMRTIDRIEENMRLEQNCEKFRADHCVTKCEIRNKVEIFGDLAYTFPSYYGYE